MEGRNDLVVAHTAPRAQRYTTTCDERLPLCLRVGTGKRRPHFALVSQSASRQRKEGGGGGGQMTDWHKRWQEVFPKSMTEVPIGPSVCAPDAVGRKRFADVLLECDIPSGMRQTRQIEFQHSEISRQDVLERDEDYANPIPGVSLGSSCVWVLDVRGDLRVDVNGVLQLYYSRTDSRTCGLIATFRGLEHGEVLLDVDSAIGECDVARYRRLVSMCGGPMRDDSDAELEAVPVERCNNPQVAREDEDIFTDVLGCGVAASQMRSRLRTDGVAAHATKPLPPLPPLLPTAVRIDMAGMSKEQQKVVDGVVARRTASGVQVVQAYAGSGKTRVAEELFKYMSPETVWYMTFNTKNQIDFAKKLARSDEEQRWAAGDDDISKDWRSERGIRSECGMPMSLAHTVSKKRGWGRPKVRFAGDYFKCAAVKKVTTEYLSCEKCWRQKETMAMQQAYLEWLRELRSTPPPPGRKGYFLALEGLADDGVGRCSEWWLREIASYLDENPGATLAFPWKTRGPEPRLWIVDEAQDISRHTLQILRHYGERCNVLLVGDRNQSINGFRGAFADGAAVRPDRWPGAFDGLSVNYHLSGSYRFGGNIAALLTTLIHAKTDSGAVRVQGIAQQQGVMTIASDNDEMLKLSRGTSTSYLARSNLTLLTTADRLFRQGLPFALPGGCQKGQGVLLAFSSMNAKEKSKMTKGFEQHLHEAAGTHDGAGVQLMTVHRAKGLEWDTVLVDYDIFQACHCEADGEKLLYVALSRARVRLVYTAESHAVFEQCVAALNPTDRQSAAPTRESLMVQHRNEVAENSELLAKLEATAKKMAATLSLLQACDNKEVF